MIADHGGGGGAVVVGAGCGAALVGTGMVTPRRAVVVVVVPVRRGEVVAEDGRTDVDAEPLAEVVVVSGTDDDVTAYKSTVVFDPSSVVVDPRPAPTVDDPPSPSPSPPSPTRSSATAASANTAMRPPTIAIARTSNR